MFLFLHVSLHTVLGKHPFAILYWVNGVQKMS